MSADIEHPRRALRREVRPDGHNPAVRNRHVGRAVQAVQWVNDVPAA